MKIKPKICLIYTGGTIGMIETSDGRRRPPRDPADFVKIAPELKEFVEIDFVPIINKDSTNMNPTDWKLMAETVYNYDRSDERFKGFVIAHGTDTMHFSSSALAFAFGRNLSFPIVFTGAQTTPKIAHGDARINLLRACKVALTDLAEVVVSFGDYIFRGCRVQKKDEKLFDAFESPGYFPIGHITEVIELHPIAQTRNKIKDGEIIEFKPTFESGILEVSLIPGLEPELILPVIEKNECKGIILQSFGMGNVPNEEPYSFRDVIKHAVKDLNKPVIITSQFPAHSTHGSAYEPGLEAVEAGAIPTGNMTSAAATSKFRWILAQVAQEIETGNMRLSKKISEVKKRMAMNYVQEMD